MGEGEPVQKIMRLPIFQDKESETDSTSLIQLTLAQERQSLGRARLDLGRHAQSSSRKAAVKQVKQVHPGQCAGHQIEATSSRYQSDTEEEKIAGSDCCR
jgi:hypothetical protein